MQFNSGTEAQIGLGGKRGLAPPPLANQATARRPAPRQGGNVKHEFRDLWP